MENNPDKSFNNQPVPASGQTSATPAVIQKLQAVLDRFEVHIADAQDLVVLQDYELYVIADDSGSMQGAAEPPRMRQIGQPAKSRWDELKETVSAIIEVASCFDETGVDVFFLNRAPVMKVKNASDAAFTTAFSTPPRGGTPLTETMERVSAHLANSERKVLIFVLTDGEPNGGKKPFKNALHSITAGGKVKIQIMACTPEDSEVEWLNDIDADLKAVDVTDDYIAERAEVVRAGIAPNFSRGDWILKALLGPVSRKFDTWDEKLGKRKIKSDPCAECAIM